VQDGGRDLSAFRRAATTLGASIHPAHPAAEVALVRLCRLSLDDGGVGFERWEVGKRGKGRVGSVTSTVAYRYREGIQLMELDATETIDAKGQIDGSTLVRVVGEKQSTKSVIRRRAGASYEYELTTAQGSTSGQFRTKSASGLPSAVAIAKRI